MLRLEVEHGTLVREGERIVLVPKVVALLRALADRGGRVCTKDELMTAVWPDVTVEEGNLAKLVFALRKVLGEEAIETVPRRGYRLMIAVQVGETPREINPVAYELYIQGRYLWNRRPGDVMWRAIECFERAIALDARFALAWAAIADVYATLGSWEAGVLPHAEAHAKAWSYATRALEIDPTLVPALTTRAYSTLHYAWDLAQAARRFEKATALDPSYAPAHHWFSHSLAAAGRFDESLVASRRALALDPMNLLMHVHLAWHYLISGAHTDGLEVASRVVAMDPQFHWGHYFVGWGAEMTGDVTTAIDSMRLALRCAGDDAVMLAGLGRALAVAGDRAAVAPIMTELAARGLFDYELALIHLAFGDHAAACDALHRARTARSGWLAYAAVDPRLATLRDDPAFPAVGPLAL